MQDTAVDKEMGIGYRQRFSETGILGIGALVFAPFPSGYYWYANFSARHVSELPWVGWPALSGILALAGALMVLIGRDLIPVRMAIETPIGKPFDPTKLPTEDLKPRQGE